MRYYEVSVRTWVSADFKSLTQEGQLLWLFFLCGPIKTPLPGFYSVGSGACLDHLRWPVDKFINAMQELKDRNMLVFDDKYNVVYLPKWAKYNRPPSNPNVLKSWLSLLENVPDCELKKKYIDDLTAVVRELDASIQAILDGWIRLYGIATGPVGDIDIDYSDGI